jgi:hypothetical protein
MDRYPTATLIGRADLKIAETPARVQGWRTVSDEFARGQQAFWRSRMDKCRETTRPLTLYLLASSYNEANMANNLARRDGAERLCSGWLQDSDIPRRQERLGPIILRLHVPTPVQNQLPSKLLFELAFNLSGTQVVCSNRSCILLELAYVQERESYSSNK